MLLAHLKEMGELVKQVNKFKHLGYTVTKQMVGVTQKSNKRIFIVKDLYKILSSVMTNRNISFYSTMRVLKSICLVSSTVKYDCWTMCNLMKKKVEATEIWF